MFLTSHLFSSIFRFWVQYFASNHMSSQAIYPRLLPWHYNDRQYQNNIVHCKSYILRKDNLNLLEDNTQLS